ncbi:hypothetical protein RvY_18212 [Ramazzottius varieornatus]|uniref:Uncharacterized protein n=1 Tax=Ramazzottius varieornatus TaxID=947166 RepID=A0A1D1W8C5_RAMVA|nr:hypothetical protein RvY_18212 [Ramazzottius varieornatus]
MEGKRWQEKVGEEGSNVVHLRGCGSYHYVGLKRSLSQDPLLAPNAVGGPFQVILPSRKYDDDYPGERVQWLPNGQTVQPVEDAPSMADVQQNGAQDSTEDAQKKEGPPVDQLCPPLDF